MSLKEELLRTVAAAEMPPYQLLLPAGWAEYTPKEATQKLLLDSANARFRAAHRPDLAAQMQRMVAMAFDQMRRNETLAFYMHAPGEDEAVLPISITVTKRRAPDGQTFDATAADLIRNHGAVAFTDDRSMLRWVKDSTHELERERVATLAISYLTPIPGTQRREVLQLAAVIPHPLGMDPESELLSSYAFACDAIVSTFTWLAA